MRRLIAIISVGFAAALLAGCGKTDSGGESNGLLDPATLTQSLPPEARSLITSYEQDLLGAAASYKAEFGYLPKSFADIASVAGAREVAVTVLADRIGEHLPFASRETAQKAANTIMTAAEQKILDKMKAQDAQN